LNKKNVQYEFIVLHLDKFEANYYRSCVKFMWMNEWMDG